jgi:hypothetical protein
MKNQFQFSLLLFILFSCGTYAQDNYKVIKVNGTITIKARGTDLQTGTVFTDKDDLLFRTAEATAAVINPQKGRLILTSRNHDLSAANSNYLPPMYSMATRGTLISRADLQNHFSGKYAILEKLSMVMNKTNFPMDKDHFFFFRYAYKSENINKKLDFSGDTLIIDRKKLYTVDGKPIPGPDNTRISLYYKNGPESVLINNFELIFPDNEKIKQEIQVILEAFKNRPYKEKLGEINSYVTEFYGKVDRSNLVSWAEKNFKLKAE